MGRLHGLDALRGVAALMVVVYHANDGAHLYLAVDFFFALSGFVMARTYESRFSGTTAPRFLFSRYRRFLPLVALGTAIGALAMFREFEAPVLLFLITTAILFVPVSTGASTFPLNPPAWSLFSELAANFLHALLLHRLPVRWLVAISLCAVAVSAWADPRGLVEYPYFGIPRVFIGYPLGIALWRINSDAPRLPWSLGLAVLVGGPLLVSLGPGWGDFVFAVVAPLIVLCGLSASPFGRLGTVLGAISFPLYAIHAPLLYLSGRMLGSPYAGAVMALVAALLIAAFGHWRTARRGLLAAVAT